MKNYYVYILASKRNGTLYIGVTNDLTRRVYEHKNDLVHGFSNKYQTHLLVYFEITTNIESAIVREKNLKKIILSGRICMMKSYKCTGFLLSQE
jgi:putative endonuclease